MTGNDSLRALPGPSSFAGDDGSADPAALAVLRDFVANAASLADVVDVLAPTRVLIPVLASASESSCHDPDTRRAASGVVAIKSPDGRWALPVFTDVAAMSAWNMAVRPVPALLQRAALSAVAEEWSLLVVNPAGPATVVVPRPAVWALAQDQPWYPAVTSGQVDAAIDREIRTILGGISSVVRVWAEPGRTAEVAVVLRLDAGLDRHRLDQVISAVNAALARSSLLAERVDGLELRIGAA